MAEHVVRYTYSKAHWGSNVIVIFELYEYNWFDFNLIWMLLLPKSAIGPLICYLLQ